MIIVKILISKRDCEDAIIVEPTGQDNTAKYKWTANISDLVELIYAIYFAHCINDGDVALKQIVTAFESMFKIKISQSSHTFNKNCERVEKTPFIQKLLDNLISEIADRDK